MKDKTINWKEKIKSQYDNDADKWVLDITKEPLKYYYSPYFKTLFRKNLLGKYALDIGCGAGTFTFELCKYKFRKIYALDLSEKMLYYLDKEREKRRIKNIRTMKGDIENMPFKDNYFDFIVLVGMMECLINNDRALKEIYRILKPGGSVSIRWLNKQGLWGTIESIRRFFRISQTILPTNSLSEIDSTLLKLKKMGFKINKVKGMVMLPFFLFPRPFSWLLETLLIKTRLVYKIEGIGSTDKNTIRRWYYSFCTELKKYD